MAENNKMLLRSLTRQFNVTTENIRADVRGSVISIALSSQTPVQRDFGYEVLDHSAAAVDLGRLRDGGPFLVGHDVKDQVGVLENVRIDSDKVIRADVRFSRSARGQDIMHDMEDGIRPHVSIGYAVRSMKKVRNSDNVPTYIVDRWEPFEASTVAIPADTTVGVARSAEYDKEYEVEVIDEAVTEERAVTYTTEAESTYKTSETTTIDEDKVVTETTVTSETHTVSTMEVTPDEGTPEEEAAESPEIEEAEEPETTPEPEQERSVKDITNQTPVETQKMEHINVADPVALTGEKREYSLVNAINGIVNNKRSGYEFEVHQELAKRFGDVAPNTFYMPTVQLRTLTAGTATAGAEWVFTEPGEFISALYPKSVVLGLGAQVIQATGKVGFPVQSGSAIATWASENGAGVSAADFQTEQRVLDPKLLIARTGMSTKLAQISAYSVEGQMRQDFALQFAAALDKAVLQGTGSLNQPTGIYYAVGTSTVTGTSGSAPTFQHFVDAETAVANLNADINTMAYVVTPSLRGKLKTTTTNPSGTTGEFIYMNNEINGYKAVASTQLPAASAIFGDWSNVIIGEFGAIKVIVDPYTEAAKGNVILTAQWLADVVLKHPEGFAVMKQFKLS